MMKVYLLLLLVAVACVQAHGHGHGHGRGEGREHGMAEKEVVGLGERVTQFTDGTVEVVDFVLFAPAHMDKSKDRMKGHDDREEITFPQNVNSAYCDQLEDRHQRSACLREVIKRMESDQGEVVYVLEALADNTLLIQIQLLGVYSIGLLITLVAFCKLCARRRALRKMAEADMALSNEKPAPPVRSQVVYHPVAVYPQYTM